MRREKDVSHTVRLPLEKIKRATHPRHWGSGRREADPFLPDHDDQEKNEDTDPPKEEIPTSTNSPTDSTEGNRSPEKKTDDNVSDTSGDQTAEPPDKSGETEESDNTSFQSRIREATSLTTRWNFLWAFAISWTIGPHTLIAIWDRIALFIREPQLMSSDEPLEFRILNGPGRWFRDTVGQHWEDGTFDRIILCAAFGVIPLMLIGAANSWPQHGKWFLRTAILGPCVYVVGIAYAGWTLTWQDIYLVTLFATAAYCSVWLQKFKETGPRRCLLLVPIVSVLSGLLYAPGAAW